MPPYEDVRFVRINNFRWLPTLSTVPTSFMCNTVYVYITIWPITKCNIIATSVFKLASATQSYAKICRYLSTVHLYGKYNYIWAASWQTNKMACAPSEDSDQPGHPPSLIRVFAVRLKKARLLSYTWSAQRKLWSDWAGAQADLSLCWEHMPFCWFCHDAAHIIILTWLQQYANSKVCQNWEWLMEVNCRAGVWISAAHSDQSSLSAWRSIGSLARQADLSLRGLKLYNLISMFFRTLIIKSYTNLCV